MVTLSTGMLLALLIAGAITTLAMLSVFANIIGHETQLHDLRNRVKDLQFEHAVYIARINNQIADEDDDIIEVDEIIDDDSDQITELNSVPELHLSAATDTQPAPRQPEPARAIAA